MRYDSKFEQQLHESVLKNFIYHPCTREFTVKFKYTPDFGVESGGNIYYIETKGYIYSGRDARNYTEFRKSLQCNEELIFLFQNPAIKLNWKSKRKDGTKMTMAEWADVNSFRWFTAGTACVLLYELKQRVKVDEEKKKHITKEVNS